MSPERMLFPQGLGLRVRSRTASSRPCRGLLQTRWVARPEEPPRQVGQPRLDRAHQLVQEDQGFGITQPPLFPLFTAIAPGQ